ncbi:putative phosphorylase b kinase regulatory subunit alpha [Blattella germanica]|nr:putative phosphorylase b kinase regulatory subunit alpha [Blattella germanica]
MRSRSNSGVRLDYYQRIVHKIIMNHQNPVTGLFPASPHNDHAWIRDNVYCILAVWGLSMAYKKIADMDEDRAKTYELEQSCVKLMRGLLMAMMQQKDKVEKFKGTQNPLDALHAKYSSSTGQSVVRDDEWGHLQIDADYGVWERGDKTNHGLPELNASSIGMAKAALEAMNELDLFGARGGPSSIIHVLADEAQKCQAVLQSMLPRESSSKELDSGLLSVISFPAFAVDDPQLIQLTRTAIVSKLQGRYGCKRFLRDGHKTPKEDPNRLYYEPWELRMFENIECEWPLFFCYLIMDYCFQGNKNAVVEYTEALEEIMIRTEDGMKLVPELYAVPGDKVAGEYREPGSQERIALGRCPFLWAQSLYILGKLLQEGFLAVGELDPLNRRLCSEKKPDVVVQVVILAEDNEIREKLRQHDIIVQTIDEVAPIEVQPARVLRRNKKLGLTGRKSRDVGILSTSKLYSLHDRVFAFTPQLTDLTRFYIASDYELMIDIFKSELNFLKSSWQNMLGRPLVVMAMKNIHLAEIVGMSELERRPSVFIPSISVESDRSKSSPRSPSPEDLVPLWKQNATPRIRLTSETQQYADTEVEELLTMLRETEHLEEQGDILQYLVDTQGLDFNTGIVEDGKVVTVKDLLKVLYEKACQQKLWGLVRHTAGMLGKRVEDLAKAVTDLLVRQKQHTITAPLPEMELRQLIHQAYGDDESSAMLTQELLVYLAMFIRTEPQLFLEMLRLRVGLIIQRSQIGSLLGGDSDGSEDAEPDRQGQWLRRRRLDGALNRVPRDFYPRVWGVLERMTPGELKFALAVETVLNSIPQPEYRQLIVEALMVLTLVTEYNIAGSLGGIIAVENLIKVNGDATLCCAKPKDQREIITSGGLLCGGAAYVCQHFYDSAPSGSYGTMTYITRAVASMLDCLPRDGEMDCSIS